jgi:hypothetical protein
LIEAEIEGWQRYGAYLNGVTGIARRCHTLTFEHFYCVLCSYPSHGGWGKEALRNAFNSGEAARNDYV